MNLVEIDLLCAGEWVVWIPEVPKAGHSHYKACVFRASNPRQREFYPINLRERLPAIRIPLRSTDPDAVLDLQPLVDQVRERGRYGGTRYDRPLGPPLSSEDQVWADALPRERGLGQ